MDFWVWVLNGAKLFRTAKNIGKILRGTIIRILARIRTTRRHKWGAGRMVFTKILVKKSTHSMQHFPLFTENIILTKRQNKVRQDQRNFLKAFWQKVC
jgi:hypothetical protein